MKEENKADLLGQSAQRIMKQNLFTPDETVLAMVSGGADSVFLFHVLKTLTSMGALGGFCVYHCNHGIDPKQNDSHEAFVKGLCQNEHIRCFVTRENVPLYAQTTHQSLEAAGRTLRYTHARRLLKQYGLTKLCTAHNKDDQTETVLLHLLRGCGIGGLQGMTKDTEDIVRPLLQTGANEIRQYLNNAQIPYVTDQSNIDSRYTRNFLRQEIIPRLKTRNPAFDDTLSALSRQAAAHEEYIEDVLQTLDLKTDTPFAFCVSIAADLFDALPPYLKQNIILHLAMRLNCQKDINRKKITEALTALQSSKTTLSCALKKDLHVFRSYTRIGVQKIIPRPALKPCTLSVPCTLLTDSFMLKLSVLPQSQAPPHTPHTLFVDFDKLSLPLCLRPRRQGERFTPYRGKTKSMKKYMIEKKIPQNLREFVPILESNGKAFAVLGYTIDDAYQVDQHTKRILKIDYTPISKNQTNKEQTMKNDIERILITQQDLQERIAQLGKQIKEDYKGKEPFCICVLKGAVVFMTDLIRAIDMPLSIDFMDISSYGSSTTSSGEVKIIKDLECAVQGKDILIVEDIFDTGLTLEYLISLLETRGANSIKVCSLLLKKRSDQNQKNVHIDYVGFTIPDEFVVGYGLDFDQKYRNLPYIGVLKEEVYR